MKNKSGFTLIEVLVVITLSVMLMLSSSALFLTFLISKSKASSTQLVKNEGEYALDKMAFMLRNALELEENSFGQTCEMSMTEISLKSLDGQQTIFSLQTDPSDSHLKIASNAAYLTSSSVDLVDDELTFDCQRSADKRAAYVKINFALRKGTPGVDLARDIVEEIFETGVVVRN